MTKVIFRKRWWKTIQEWKVFAFFPDAHVNPGNIMCYEHLGQHAEARQEFYWSCKPCMEKEYAPLKKELETVCQYDDLKVVSRWMRRDQEMAWYPERFKDEAVVHKHMERRTGGTVIRSKGISRNYVASVSQEQLDALPHPTLEDILMFMNGGKYTPFFLKKPKRFKDGSKDRFTKVGAKVYSKLISTIYACARMTNEDVESMVETMDAIVTGDWS